MEAFSDQMCVMWIWFDSFRVCDDAVGAITPSSSDPAADDTGNIWETNHKRPVISVMKMQFALHGLDIGLYGLMLITIIL